MLSTRPCSLHVQLALLLVACGGASEPPKRVPDSGAQSADAAVPVTPEPTDDGVQVTEDAELDYEDEHMWLCRPGIANDQCARNLDATELLANGEQRLVPHVRATDPAIDCFYVYPTVDITSGGIDTDFTPRTKLDALLNQAARFTSQCRVFAPYYRQVALNVSEDREAKLAKASLDVIAAFDRYLSRWNDGRPFVLIGHSQGSDMLRRLIETRFEADPALRKQLLVAMLLGFNMLVPQGEDRGGTFANIPVCTRPGQAGCVMGLVSYSVESPPGEGSAFGADQGEQSVVCTDPQDFAGNDSGRLGGVYFPTRLENPLLGSEGTTWEVDTPFVLYRTLFTGQCKHEAGFSYFQLSAEAAQGDLREIPRLRHPLSESIGFGTHLVDWAMVLGDMLVVVENLAQARAR